MASKTDFDSTQWDRLMSLPWVAGILVVFADPSFRMLGEFTAMTAAAVDDEQKGPAEALIAELVADIKVQRDGDVDRDEDGGEIELLTLVSEAAATLDEACAPDEAAHVKQWAFDVAHATAEARKEGGFVGIGAVRISQSEQEMLDKIGTALGLPDRSR